MGKSKGSRATKPEASSQMVTSPGGTAGNVSAPGLAGHSFEAAVIGSAAGGSTNGPARIFLSPTLMMAEAIGTGDLLAVGRLGSAGELVDLTTLHQQAGSQSPSSCGDFFTLADAWPSPKLPRDAARLSPPLADSFAQPPGGSALRIFPLHRIDTRSAPDSQSASGSKAAAARPPLRATIQTEQCSNFHLQWVPPHADIHTESQPLPLSPLTPPSKENAPSRPGIPPGAQSPGSPQTPNPQNVNPQTPGLRAQDSGPPTPQTPRGRRPPPASPATPKGRNVSGGSASPSPSPLKRNQEEQRAPRMTEGQRAAVTSLLGDSKGRGVVETYAARWLGGRYLIEGNHVIVPLCGFNCTFQVLHPAASESATSPSPEEPSFSFHPPKTKPPLPPTPAPPLVAYSVVGATKVSLLEPVENEPDAQTRGGGKAGSENREDAEMGEPTEEERVGYSELGGVGEQIKALRELVELPLRRPEMFKRYGIRPPRGVLLYGPPGTGKTLLARAAASDSGASMFVINGPEIVSAHYGESEEALRDVFAAAEKAAPSVIFIDELDAIAPARDTDTEDLAQRMVAALLTLLDGGNGDFNRVIVIAATNRPESIDPALRRPGRFDRELEIGVPTPQGRLEILHTLLRGKRHSLRPSDVKALAAATHGFVGADLAALCNEAALNALRRLVGVRAPSAQISGPHIADVRKGDDTSRGGVRTEEKGRVGNATGEVGSGIRSGECSFGERLESVRASVGAEDTGSEGLRSLGNHLRATSSGEISFVQDHPDPDVRLASDVTARLSLLALGESSQSGNSAALALDSSAASTFPLDANLRNPSNPPNSQPQRVSDSSSQLPSSSTKSANASRTPPISADPTVSQTPSTSLSASISHDPPSSAKPPESRNLSKPPSITLTDFEAAQTKIRPSAMREVMIEVPRVRWADIGGQEATKQKLQETVEWPQKHPEAFSRVGAQAPRGVLLYGPPGCSKTLMARAVATEAGLNFLAVKGPELFSKWVGESEKAVRALFARARASSPSIIFFDEIDGLAATRDDGSADGGTGVSDRVMSQLLTELDGLSPLAGVAIIGATNRPDIIDPALLRPGRFDRMLFVGPPDRKAREQIFGICLRATPCDSGVRIDDLAERTEKYTGADIAAVCREAALAALEEDLSATGVKPRHFDAALTTVRPSISTHDEAFYASFQRG